MHIQVIPVHILIGGGRTADHLICAVQIDTGDDVYIHILQHLAVVTAQGDHHGKCTFTGGRLCRVALGVILNSRLAVTTDYLGSLLQGHT